MVVLLQNEPYPYDTRVRQEAEALIEAGYSVTVIAPNGGDEPSDATVGRVDVLRFPPAPGGRGVLGYVREYAVSLYRLGRLARRVRRQRPVDVVFTASPPDFLVLIALPMKWRGAKLVFDHHDLSPELFQAKFARRGVLHWLLLRAEGLAFRCADVVIATNDAYAEVARIRGRVDPARLFVVPNVPDPGRIFPVTPRPELRRGRERLVVWMGMMSRQESLGLLVDAADELVRSRRRTDIAFALVGPGDARETLVREVQRRGLASAVELPGAVPDDLLRTYLSTADVCVSVDEPNDMNDRSMMTKVLEYMATGRPVIQSPLAEMRRICGDTTVYISHLDRAELADRIEELIDDPERGKRLGEAGRRRVEDGLLWPDQVPNLLSAISTALSRS